MNHHLRAFVSNGVNLNHWPHTWNVIYHDLRQGKNWSSISDLGELSII